MTSLLNKERPPVFCPGCAHEQVVRALDKAFQNLGLAGNQICLVSDIGCSGLFDTFFHTHAFHGLHGRVLTYAAGIKLSRPELKVVATMGDGGLGIGGAHLLAACRRNLDMTLIVLNNFNFGMTGGQCSVTTPPEAEVASGFLNRLDKPLDLMSVATAAGAAYVSCHSTYQKGLEEAIEAALRFEGFAIVEILGICPGRYTKKNKLTPKAIDEMVELKPSAQGPVAANARIEYGQAYRAEAARQRKVPRPAGIEKTFTPPAEGRRDVIVLGSAGQRVITAGELVALAAMSAGLFVTQKNDYNITVLRGPSIAELILSPEPVGFTAIQKPAVVLALAPEGVARRKELFAKLDETTLVIQAAGVELPATEARIQVVDFKAAGIKNEDWSLAGLAAMAKLNQVLTSAMLDAALNRRFRGEALAGVRGVVEKVVV